MEKERKIESGQIWKYKTRKGEEDSKILILKIEKNKIDKIIVHVFVMDVNIENQKSKAETYREIKHLPFSKKAILDSITKLESSNNTLPDYKDGYDEWKAAYENGKGGVFSIEVKEAIDYIEQTIN